MSNQAVGNVYQTIIDEVVNSSRVDFEENGVEESVLEELRLVSPAPSFLSLLRANKQSFRTHEAGRGGSNDGVANCPAVLLSWTHLSIRNALCEKSPDGVYYDRHCGRSLPSSSRRRGRWRGHQRRQ